MSEHLNECDYVWRTEVNGTQIVHGYCICPALRACEQRIKNRALAEAAVTINAEHERGYAEALDRAREVVEAVGDRFASANDATSTDAVYECEMALKRLQEEKQFVTLAGYSEGYGAAMDDGWGEPKHIEAAVLAERERITTIIKDYYKVAPKAAETLLGRIEEG